MADTADIEHLRAVFSRKFDLAQKAEDNLRVAYANALHAKYEAVFAELQLHTATGKYNAKERRELDEQMVYLAHKRDSPYAAVRRMLDCSYWKRFWSSA